MKRTADAHAAAPRARPRRRAFRHRAFLASTRHFGRRHPAVASRWSSSSSRLLGRNHAAVVQILGSPLVAIIMLLFIINTAYHMWIGMQEIILDYVHEENLKLLSLMGNTFFVFAVAFASAYAILKLSFGV